MGGQGVRCVPHCARRGAASALTFPSWGYEWLRAEQDLCSTDCFSERDAPGCGGMEQELLGVARTAGAGL